MSLYQEIQDDIKVAMKGRDTRTLEVLRMLWSSVKNKAIELKKELDDTDVLPVIKSDVKKIEDSIESFVQGQRQDLADKAQKELVILKKYLPLEMSDENLEIAVKKVLDEIVVGNPSEIGRAIGSVMKELKGQVDGKRVKLMVKRILEKK